jgi:hypothetical protein
VSYLSEEAGARLISQSDLLKSIDRANPIRIDKLIFLLIRGYAGIIPVLR